MAGEWIKMRTNLWDDPRVSRLCDLVDQPEAMVVGALYWLWAMADEHSEDGLLPGLTLRTIDRKTGVPGMGLALVQIGWLSDAEAGVTVVNFAEHNGVSAKRRCSEAKRKAGSRTVSACDADKKQTPCGAREEKNINTLSQDAHEAGQAPIEQQSDTAPMPMTLDWQPDHKRLNAVAFRAGVTLAGCLEALGAFVVHHEAKGLAKSSAEWHAALVAWAKRDAAHGVAKVTPLHSARSAAPAQGDDWAANGVRL